MYIDDLDDLIICADTIKEAVHLGEAVYSVTSQRDLRLPQISIEFFHNPSVD